jgi:hypothetical protein
VWPSPALAALLAAVPVLAACGSGEPVSPPYVAEFGLGTDTPEARQFVLTPMPGTHVQVLRAPEITPADPGEDGGTTTTAAPGSRGQAPRESAFQPSVTWVRNGRYLAVVTWGSGSCPSGPGSIDVVAEQTVEIRLAPLFPDRDPCTADMSGHVTVVELPRGVTPTRPLVARFGDHETTLHAVVR